MVEWVNHCSLKSSGKSRGIRLGLKSTTAHAQAPASIRHNLLHRLLWLPVGGVSPRLWLAISMTMTTWSSGGGPFFLEWPRGVVAMNGGETQLCTVAGINNRGI
ncbi:hypothetical protein HRI_003893400 [Hibiscus trionum]|uniref:Uncharacterized protein n=1 Tax=Hibiscus trionum TaxID=183268 RepID=A0A9W7ITW0_HIBTR|nr:hypothetical protein HRI_003893400 [Hibiscus trionum]